MSIATRDRTEALAEHRESLELAKTTIFDGPSLGDEFGDLLYASAALEALAQVSVELWGLAVVSQMPDREIGDDELAYEKVRQIAPMKRDVAEAIFAHRDRVEAIREMAHEKTCKLEAAVQGLVRTIAGYGEDVALPVLEAAKTLDLSTEVES